MPDLALMSQAVDFIEDNLQEAIMVADIADAVSYSLYYFCRTFNQATHHTPYDYLMRRRLSESAQALLQTDEKIIDIGLDYQFNSPETFSRAFKRMFGLQPTQLRKQATIDPRWLMPRLTDAHIRHIIQGPYLKPTLVTMDAFDVVGLMTLVSDNQTTAAALWDLFVQGPPKRRDSAREPRSYYAITFYPEGWERHGYPYMVGIQVKDPDLAHETLVLKRIPASKYARFIHKGTTSDLYLTLDYVYHTWLPKSDQSLSHPWVVEFFGQDIGSTDHEQAEREIFVPIE